MMNYSNFRSHSERFSMHGIDEGKLESLASKLDYPIEDIMCAIREVGFDREEIEEYIRDRYNRGI
jgi:hypothetical protein